MKKFLLAATMILACITVNAQNNNEYYVEVTGKAIKEVVPDEIYLSITINQESTKGKMSIDELERKMINEMKRKGIDTDKALSVSDMSSDLQTFILKKKQVQTTKNYMLKLSTPKQVTEVFEILADLDIPDTKVVNSTYSDIEEVKNQMRVTAVKNARDIATSLAEACGQKIGNAIMIIDNNYLSGSTNYNNGLMLRMSNIATDSSQEKSAGMGETYLEFEKLKFSYTVNVRFQLLPSTAE